MSAKRVTIRDIAIKLEVHHSTVSRALRNDYCIPIATRTRVQQAAKELGYYPDPMLSALMLYRSKQAPKSFRGLLAWVTNYPTREGWRQFEKIGFYAGASRQAELLGYELEPFWLHEPGMTARRFNQILSTRNVQGLLFIPQPRSHVHVRLEWDRFSAITFGPTLRRPQLRMIDSDHYHCMALVIRELKRRGYNRPGLACDARVNESVNRHWAAAFWAFQSLPVEKQVPLYVDREWNYASFKKWFLKNRPDVVVGHTEDVLRWMLKMGLRIPEDVGFATPARHGVPSHCSGVDENSDASGEAAVNAVVGMIRRGERGIPKTPITTLIPGFWVDGTTLRKLPKEVKG